MAVVFGQQVHHQSLTLDSSLRRGKVLASSLVRNLGRHFGSFEDFIFSKTAAHFYAMYTKHVFIG